MCDNKHTAGNTCLSDDEYIAAYIYPRPHPRCIMKISQYCNRNTKLDICSLEYNDEEHYIGNVCESCQDNMEDMAEYYSSLPELCKQYVGIDMKTCGCGKGVINLDEKCSLQNACPLENKLSRGESCAFHFSECDGKKGVILKESYIGFNTTKYLNSEFIVRTCHSCCSRSISLIRTPRELLMYTSFIRCSCGGFRHPLGYCTNPNCTITFLENECKLHVSPQCSEEESETNHSVVINVTHQGNFQTYSIPHVCVACYAELLNKKLSLEDLASYTFYQMCDVCDSHLIIDEKCPNCEKQKKEKKEKEEKKKRKKRKKRKKKEGKLE